MEDGNVWSVKKGFSISFSFFLEILRVNCPATDFIFSFSITLLTVAISHIDCDSFILNKSVLVYLAVGSCQNIFFVDDDTTAGRIMTVLVKRIKIYWRMFRNKIIICWVLLQGVTTQCA